MDRAAASSAKGRMFDSGRGHRRAVSGPWPAQNSVSVATTRRPLIGTRVTVCPTETYRPRPGVGGLPPSQPGRGSGVTKPVERNGRSVSWNPFPLHMASGRLASHERDKWLRLALGPRLVPLDDQGAPDRVPSECLT